jgi:hypothetical protein
MLTFVNFNLTWILRISIHRPSPDHLTSVVNKIGFSASSSRLAFIDRFFLCLLASGWDFPRYPWVLPKLPSF